MNRTLNYLLALCFSLPVMISCNNEETIARKAYEQIVVIIKQGEVKAGRASLITDSGLGYGTKFAVPGQSEIFPEKTSITVYEEFIVGIGKTTSTTESGVVGDFTVYGDYESPAIKGSYQPSGSAGGYFILGVNPEGEVYISMSLVADCPVSFYSEYEFKNKDCIKQISEILHKAFEKAGGSETTKKLIEMAKTLEKEKQLKQKKEQEEIAKRANTKTPLEDGAFYVHDYGEEFGAMIIESYNDGLNFYWTVCNANSEGELYTNTYQFEVIGKGECKSIDRRDVGYSSPQAIKVKGKDRLVVTDRNGKKWTYVKTSDVSRYTQLSSHREEMDSSSDLFLAEEDSDDSHQKIFIRDDIERPQRESLETVPFPLSSVFISSDSNFTVTGAKDNYFAYDPVDHWGVLIMHYDNGSWARRYIYCTGWNKERQFLAFGTYDQKTGKYIGTLEGTFKRVNDKYQYTAVFTNSKGAHSATFYITED